jgi:hypothetical protein
MQVILEILRYTIPSLIVFAGVYLLVRSFLTQQLERERLRVRLEAQSQTLPLKMAAYERASIFLQRIAPESSVPRHSNFGTIPAIILHRNLVEEIRTEFEHICSQQIYMSVEAWANVIMAKEQTLTLHHRVLSRMEENSTNIDFAKAIFELCAEENIYPSKIAQEFLNKEVSKIL